MLKVLLLVWLAALFVSSPAGADTALPSQAPLYTDVGNGYLHVGFQSANPDLSPSNIDVDSAEPHGASAYGFEASRSRADLYSLVKLAVDELEFLAGIRLIWDQTEKKFNRLALKLKLKGDISLAADDGPPASRDAHADIAAIHTFTERYEPSHSSISLRSIFIPKKIKWNFGFDPSAQMAFGELRWGSFIALQSDVGAHQQIKLVFEYAF